MLNAPLLILVGVIKTERGGGVGWGVLFYLLIINVLHTVSGLRCFNEPPLDLQIHRGGSALESTRHFYVLSLFHRHVGGQIREATCR